MKKWLFFFCILNALQPYAQEIFDNVIYYEQPPKAIVNLDDLDWMIGSWKGEELGGIVEETWFNPSGQTMMGTFKLVKEGATSFYELFSIITMNGQSILKLKHFDNELKGWEEKDETENYAFLKMEGRKVFFNGLTYEYVSDNQMNVYLLFGNKEKKREVTFEYFK
jgi:hypothetical protein